MDRESKDILCARSIQSLPNALLLNNLPATCCSHLCLLQLVEAATRRSLLAVTIDITSYVDGASTLTTAEAALATIGTSFGGGNVESVVTTDSQGQVVGSGARALRAGAATALAAALLLLALAA